MATKQIEEHIKNTETPIPAMWEKRLTDSLKKSIIAFQAAFGTLSFTSATVFIYKLDKDLTLTSVPWGWLLVWLVFFGIYVGTVQIDHWKKSEDLKEKQIIVDIEAKEEFNFRFVEWQYKQAEMLTNDEALQFFQNGLVMFASVSIESMDRKLTDMMMMMNNLIFNTSRAVKGKNVKKTMKDVLLRRNTKRAPEIPKEHKDPILVTDPKSDIENHISETLDPMPNLDEDSSQ